MVFLSVEKIEQNQVPFSAAGFVGFALGEQW